MVSMKTRCLIEMELRKVYLARNFANDKLMEAYSKLGEKDGIYCPGEVYGRAVWKFSSESFVSETERGSRDRGGVGHLSRAGVIKKKGPPTDPQGWPPR